MPLTWLGQEDFAAGLLRSQAPGMEPGVGVASAYNALFDDDGDVYKRGGTEWISAAPADGPIMFMWSGYLNDQPKTLVATKTASYSVNAVGAKTKLGDVGVPFPVLGAVIGDKLWLPNGQSWDGGTALIPWATHAHVATITDRLVVADGNTIRFSNSGDPLIFTPDDYHELPDGVQVVGMQAMRDTMLVFTNYGLWAITNMAYDLTDDLGNPQQTLSRLVPEVSLIRAAGLAEWSGKIIAPCTDRIYLVDPINNPVPISDSIGPLWERANRAGLKCGSSKVFRNHFFLPLIDDQERVIETLVCRLNRPVKGRMTYYPWSQFTRDAGASAALDLNLLGTHPRLLGGHVSGGIIDVTDVFNPEVNGCVDADGLGYPFVLETRDFPTGNGQPNHVRKLRIFYTMEGEGEMDVSWSVGERTQTWEALFDSGATWQDVADDYATWDAVYRGGETSGVGVLPPVSDPDLWWAALQKITLQSSGVDPAVIEFARATRARYIRGYIGNFTTPLRLTIHRIEFAVRPATHTR